MCFFLRMRLRRFLISEPTKSRRYRTPPHRPNHLVACGRELPRTAWILTGISVALAALLLGCVVVAAIRGDSETKQS